MKSSWKVRVATLVPFVVLLISYLVKSHRIEKGNFVTWDEAHFGKFSQKYLSRKFYFDVHPPLGKMLTALSGLINGQPKDFDFSTTDGFPVTFDYVGMRRFHALMASFTPLMAYLILREFKFSIRRAFLLSTLFIFENGVVSISRLVLLDSHLLTFTAAVTYFLVRLYTRRKASLFPLGLFIGCVMSVKWIGLLTTCHVGAYVILDLYTRIMFMKPLSFTKFFLKRVFYLILLPACIYLAFFYLHFKIVNKTGADDGMMSSLFQRGLEGNRYLEMTKYVTFGKKITLKTQLGYLHAHKHVYPDAEIQDVEDEKARYQVTGYTHSDKNNNLYFQKVTTGDDANFVKNGDRVVILHAKTQGYIEEGSEALITEGKRVQINQIEITPEAIWHIETFSDDLHLEDRIKTSTTQFYLKNGESGRYLTMNEEKYPHWGFDQAEVVAHDKKTKNGLFFISENAFSEGPLYTELKPNFFKGFIEHQYKMFHTNRSFIRDPDLEPDQITSHPWSWPLLTKGLRMSQWHSQYKFYMFMNPLLHYSVTVGLLVSPVVFLVGQIRRKRRELELEDGGAERCAERVKCTEGERCSGASTHARISAHARITHSPAAVHPATRPPQNVKGGPRHSRRGGKSAGGASQAVGQSVGQPVGQAMTQSVSHSHLSHPSFFLFVSLGGWLFHYLPFFLVGRVLYLHHYFPALFFGTLNLCYLLRRLPFLYCVFFISLCVLVFSLYSPLTYGFIEMKEVEWLKVFSGWDFAEEE